MLSGSRAPRQRRRPGDLATRIATPAAVLVLLMSGVLMTGLPHAQTDPEPSADRLSGQSPHAKLNRQLDIFERVIDDLLIDSKHALVDRGRNAQAAYLPGHGAVFAFEFSLAGGALGPVLALGDGNFRFFHPLDDEIDLDELDELDEDDDKDKDKSADRKRSEKDRARRRREARLERLGPRGEWLDLDEGELKKRRTRQYGQVKQELIEMLGDYGDMLEGLPADEWVNLVARPRDLPWGERKIKRLVIRARLRDIIDRSEDRIDEATFRHRLVIEEYR